MSTNDQIASFFKNKNILITGVKGFIGSSVYGALRQYGCKLTGVSRGDIGGEFSIEFWDHVIPMVDMIYHFAAQTSSALADSHPVDDIKSNVLPVVSLIQACQKSQGRPIILYSGAATEIGFTTKNGMPDSRDKPITVYDVNKLATENFLSYYSRCMDGRSVTLRLANVYGPGPKSSSSDRGILNLMVRRALNSQELTVYGTGEYTRDYVYIDDVVSAFLAAAVFMDRTNGRHFVIGSGAGYTIKEMMKLVARIVKIKTGRKSTVITVPEPVGMSQIEHRHFTADTSSFRDVTGWKAMVSLEEGISRTVDSYLNNL